MITLIVGRPRTGKTYYLCVVLLERLQRAFKKRPLVSNVRGHQDVTHVLNFDDDFTDRKYDKSLIILDEVQFYSCRDKKGEMFQHFTVHGHQERDYVWITQSTSALPTKWLGLVERTIKIETVAGSQISRALHYVGTPMRSDEPIESETFRPRATDLYKTVEDGMQPPKRRMPSKVWMLLFASLFFCVGAPMGGYFMVSHFINKTSVETVSAHTEKIIEDASSNHTGFITSAHASVFKDSFKEPQKKVFSVLHGDKFINKIENPQQLRFPMSVEEATARFTKDVTLYYSCGGRAVSDTRRFRNCSKTRARTWDESRGFEQDEISILPPS